MWKRTVSEETGKVAKHGVWLRQWQTPETDGGAKQMSCVSNGTKGYAAAAATTTATVTPTTTTLKISWISS